MEKDEDWVDILVTKCLQVWEDDIGDYIQSSLDHFLTQSFLEVKPCPLLRTHLMIEHGDVCLIIDPWCQEGFLVGYYILNEPVDILLCADQCLRIANRAFDFTPASDGELAVLIENGDYSNGFNIAIGQFIGHLYEVVHTIIITLEPIV